MGLTSTAWILENNLYAKREEKTINKDEFDSFMKEMTWSQLKGERFATKFEERFGILDFHIYFKTSCDSKLEAYIRKTYIK